MGINQCDGDIVTVVVSRVTVEYASRSSTSRSNSIRAKVVIMPVAVQAQTPAGGIKSYYQAKIEAAELLINQKTQNLRRLEAQRNALNARGESSTRCVE